MPSWKDVFRLTLPQMGLMLCHLIISMTDVWAAGRLDTSVQAAAGVAAQIFSLLMLITSLIASGCMTTITQSLGAGLFLRAGRYAGLIITLSALMGTAAAALALCCEPFIFAAMHISEELRPAFSVFFTACCCQLPFYYMLIMVNSIFRSYKKVLLPLITLAMMAAINMLGDLGFGLGFFGLPRFGAAGIAWTNFASSLIGLACNIMLARRYGILHRRVFAPWKWNKRAMPYIFKVGMPAAAGHIITQTGSLATLAVIGLLPENANILAGVSVGNRVQSILMFPLGAINMSMIIFSGYLLGGDRREVLRAFGMRMSVAAALALVPPSLLLWILRVPAAGMFSADAAVQQQASRFLCFSCMAAPFVGMTGIWSSLFSGAGASMLSCRVGAVTCWAVGIPLALFLGIALGMGALGIYAAGFAGQIAAFFWTLKLFRGKKWLEYSLRKRHTT